MHDKLSLEERIGKKIRSMRKESKMTQPQLAKKSGVSVTWISACETGRKFPSFKTVVLLLEAMGYEMIFEKKTTTRTLLP